MQELYFVAVADCFGDEFGLDDRGTFKVSDSLGDLDNLKIAAGGEGKLVRGLFEDSLCFCSELAVLDSFI